MTIELASDLSILEEAMAILMEKLPASKVARLLSAWRVGHGDYMQTRDNLFVRETVDSLFEKAKTVHPG